PGVACYGTAEFAVAYKPSTTLLSLASGTRRPAVPLANAAGRRQLLCRANNQATRVMCQVRDDLKREVRAVPRPAAVRRRSVVLGLILGLLGLLASWLPVASRLEAGLGLGLLFAARGPLPPPHEVVVVGVSRDAARALGETTELDTWSRALHAKLLDRLSAGGARTVAFDLTFHERRPGDGDAAFAASIERAGNVVLLEWTQSDVKQLSSNVQAYVETRVPPLPELKAASLGSAPFVLPTV